MAGTRFTATRQTPAAGGGVLVTATAQAGDSGVYLTLDDSLSLWEVQERVRAIMLDVERRLSRTTTMASAQVIGTVAGHGY